jgi:hypothetical protein
VGLYKSCELVERERPIAFESAWFHPLNLPKLPSVEKLVSEFAFICNLYRYSAASARPSPCGARPAAPTW